MRGRRPLAALMSGLLATALGVTLAATASAAVRPAQDPVPIRPNQYFSGFINNSPPGSAVIKVLCPGPTTTGHPVGNQPVERMNWSLQAGPALCMPLSNIARNERAEHKPSRFPEADVAANAFVRVERQTLRKLPKSGDILFTIRVYVDPIAAIAHHPNAGRLAASFAEQLEALDEQQAAYKGLTLQKAELAAKLRALADALSPV